MANGVLGRYTAAAVGAYKCPADNYLSPAQTAAGFPRRNRSLSMNSIFGRFSMGDDPTAHGLNWGFPQFRQYLKQVQVRRPAKTWLFIDEHPDSINDGYFINNPDVTHWQDIPASYHNGACGFSFADGHSEIRKWRSSTRPSTPPCSIAIRLTGTSMPPAGPTFAGISSGPATSRPAPARAMYGY